MNEPAQTTLPRRRALDLEGFVRLLSRRKSVIALCFVVVTGTVLVLSLTAQKQYTAHASLLFRDPAFDQKLFGATFISPQTDPQRDAATNVQLVSLGTVLERAQNALGRLALSRNLGTAVTVSSEGDSNVVSVSATDRDPRFAARIANAVAVEYIAFRRQADQSKIQQAIRLVQREIAQLKSVGSSSIQLRTLERQADQLRVFEALQTGNAELVQRASVPRAPSSPKVKRNVALAAVLGLILGVALALLLERLDRRLHDVDEVESAYELPVISVVPESRSLGSESEQASSLDAYSPETEVFRMMRAQLRYFNVDRDMRSLLIVSSGSGDGKTTVATHLAVASAGLAMSRRVLLLEADLRKPTIAARLGLEPYPGLAEVLAHENEFDDVVHHYSVGRGNDSDDGVYLDVVTAGARPPNPVELLESRRMADLLTSLEDKYDLVIIDTPPITMVSDTLPLMRQVSGVLIVTRLRKTTRDAASKMKDRLTKLGAPMLGVVANGYRQQDSGEYGYGYGYGYGEHERDAPEKDA